MLILPLAIALVAQTPKITTPAQALQALKTGNARSLKPDGHFIVNRPQRNQLALSQEPFAVILGCSDSRVAPEIVFDEDAGRLFVVRVAGNIVDAPTLGSVEYGVEHLHAKVILVLGHASCGAISAAMAPADVQKGLSENIRFLLDRIETGNAEDQHAATIENVKYQLRLLNENHILAKEVKEGKLIMVGGFYNIATGKVDFLK